ncbi:MAG: N-acetyltransferase [Chloroflexota bacterium]
MTAPLTPRIAIRAARPDDAPLTAQMFRLSMGGLAEMLFDDDARKTELTLIRLFTRDAGRFGYGVTVVAEVGENPLGVLAAFSGAALSRLNLEAFAAFPKILGLAGTSRLFWRAIPHASIEEAKTDEYYISNVGVLPQAQGHGIGTRLMQFAEEAAQAAGLMKCSLLVGTTNHGARRLYERLGYEVVFTRSHASPALSYNRMVKQLGPRT